MDNFNTLSVDNKEVKVALLNGRVIFSELEDQSLTNAAAANAEVSAAGIVLDETTLSGTYVPPGDTQPYTYFCYNTAPVSFVEAGAGSTHPFPVSQHVFARARHYGSAPASFTWNGQTFTVSDSVDLSAYAQAQGIDVNASAVEDIQLLFTDNEVALSAVPCLMSKLQFQGLFQKDTLSGLVAWTVPQLTAEGFACKPQPIVINGYDSAGELRWSTPQLLSAIVPAEDTSLIEYPTYLGTTGDSGRPLAVKVGDEYAIVSHNHSVEKPAFSPTAPYYMKGPDYTAAYPAIKSYVESKGDTLKTLSAWTA